MALFHERLRQLRKERDESMTDLARTVGSSKSSINMYERGEREPGMEMLETLADHFGVDLDYLMGKSDHRDKYDWLSSVSDESAGRQTSSHTDPDILLIPEKTAMIPLIGSIACGTPLTAEHNVECYMASPIGVKCDFALRCKGDSMIGDRIFDGDVVYIRSQPDVDNGQIAAVIIDDEATLKHVYHVGKTLTLTGSNPAFPPITCPLDGSSNVRILGLAVSFTATLN